MSLLLVLDKIRDEKTFVLYAKTFVPKVYNLAYKLSDEYEWKDINGSDLIPMILKITIVLDSAVNIDFESDRPYTQLLNDTMLYIIKNRHLDDFWV